MPSCPLSHFPPCRHLSGCVVHRHPGRQSWIQVHRVRHPANLRGVQVHPLVPDEKRDHCAQGGIQSREKRGDVHHRGCSHERFGQLQLCGASSQMHPGAWDNTLREQHSDSAGQGWEFPLPVIKLYFHLLYTNDVTYLLRNKMFLSVCFSRKCVLLEGDHHGTGYHTAATGFPSLLHWQTRSDDHSKIKENSFLCTKTSLAF